MSRVERTLQLHKVYLYITMVLNAAKEKLLRVTLLPNVPAFGSYSMRRYHRELFAALKTELPDEIAVEDFKFQPALFSEKYSKWALRFQRWCLYPLVLQGMQFDLIHILDQSHANLAAFCRARKKVITCHDLFPLRVFRGDFPNDTPGLNEHSFSVLVNQIKKCDHVIVPSRSTLTDLVELTNFSAEKISVVHHGTNEHFYAPSTPGRVALRQAIRERFALPADCKLIMHVGTGVPYKNVPGILRVIHELAQSSLTNFRLLRLGARPNEDEIALARDLQIEKLVIYGGQPAEDSELGDFYRASDVFLFPSLWEGFGWPVLEAMACGLPVIASTAGSLPEIVGSGGVLCSPTDYQNMAAEIIQLFTNAALNESRRQSALSRAACFSWKKAADSLAQVYKSLGQQSLRGN